MPRLLTAIERRVATQNRELARRTLAKSRRLIQSPTLSPIAKEQLAADIDDLERECAMLGILLDTRTGPSMAPFASEYDSAEEQPYQEVAR